MSEVERVNSILNKENRNRNNQYSIFNRNVKRNKRNYSEKEAKNKAMYLADKFKNPDGLKFYLKVAWNLADWYIDWLANYSTTKNDPAHYFVKVANQKMNENA